MLTKGKLMMTQPRVRQAIALSVLLAMVTVASSEEKKETPCVWKGVARIVAIGDIHGDHAQFLTCLRLAKLIDKDGNWTGGKTHLVQTGDVLDRAPDSRRSQDLLMSLEKQAEKAGGRVHALIGNHEAMVVGGDYRYLHQGEIDAFGGKEAFTKAMSPEGLYGKWLRTRNAIVQINDIIFVHGGISPVYNTLTVADLNRRVRKGISGTETSGAAANSAGPLWCRTLAVGNEKKAESVLEPFFKKNNAARIVIGHTIVKEEIQARANGKVILIDVAMSRHYGGKARCLLVEGGQFYELSEGGRRDLGLKTKPAQASGTGMTQLSPREVEIANMIRGGLTSKEISDSLHVSLRTVERIPAFSDSPR